MIMPDLAPAVLVGHQAKLLKALCQLVLAYIRYQLRDHPAEFIELQRQMETMNRLLTGAEKEK